MTRTQSTSRRQNLFELSIRHFLVWSLMLGICLQVFSPVTVLAAETRRSPKPTSKKQEAKPGATIVGIEPGRVTQGQAVTVTVRGKKTKWAKGK
ncbi:MAG TPA: hypothetical protein PLU80_12130, partial [Acidobacteriota bacterium]|nr:hypothetical protein [Acidobacteriota bacterium]